MTLKIAVKLIYMLKKQNHYHENSFRKIFVSMKITELTILILYLNLHY